MSVAHESGRRVDWLRRLTGRTKRLLALCAFVAACAAPAPAPAEATDRRDAYMAAVQEAAPGETVDLKQVAGEDWDRVVFLGRYTDNEWIKESLALDFDVEAVSPWNNTEGGTVVVLAKGSKTIAWLAVPSSDVFLHCLDGESMPASEATFMVIEDEGYRGLLDEDNPRCSYLRPP